jgi:hypothetical protein
MSVMNPPVIRFDSAPARPGLKALGDPEDDDEEEEDEKKREEDEEEEENDGEEDEVPWQVNNRDAHHF